MYGMDPALGLLYQTKREEKRESDIESPSVAG